MPNIPHGRATADRERAAWLAELRSRLLDIARRRVPDEAAEDLVQESLRIVIERAPDSAEPRPDLAWCFQVLRNTIGNYYQRQRVRRTAAESGRLMPGQAPVTPAESFETTEIVRLVSEGLRDLERGGGPCAGYLRRVAEGDAPNTIATDAGVEAAVFYRKLYRCREQLRAVLRAKGVM